jgi:hypothetical protein
MECYLSKRARSSGRNWKKRWFVFEPVPNGFSISYYKDEAQRNKNKKPSGVVTLITSNISSSVRPTYSSKDYSLEIYPGDGAPPLVIAAEDSIRFRALNAMLSSFVHEVATGWLMKRARKSGRNWKRRWVEVDFYDSKLRIYESADVSCKANSKGLQANASDVIQFNAQSIAQPSGLRKYCYELMPEEGELSLFVAAESKQKYDAWKTVFTRLVGKTSSKPTAVTATKISTPTPADVTLKLLSKKGSALFAMAVGHASVEGITETHEKRTSVGPPPSRVARGPPARRTSVKLAPSRVGRGPPARRTSVKSTPPTRRQTTAPARIGNTSGRPPPRRSVAPARRAPGRLVPPAITGRGPPPRATRSTPKGNGVADAHGEDDDDDDDDDEWASDSD